MTVDDHFTRDLFKKYLSLKCASAATFNVDG
jgi:hypothetical protein